MSAATTLHWIVEHFYIFTSLSFITFAFAALVYFILGDKELQVAIVGIVALVNAVWAYGVSHYHYNTHGLAHLTNWLNSVAYHHYGIIIIISLIAAVSSYFMDKDQYRYVFLVYSIVMIASAIIVWLYIDKYHSLYLLSGGGGSFMESGLQYN